MERVDEHTVRVGGHVECFERETGDEPLPTSRFSFNLKFTSNIFRNSEMRQQIIGFKNEFTKPV